MATPLPAEDRVLCQAWLEISTNPTCGTEQKGFAYWRKVGTFFHAQRKLKEKPFHSNRNDLSHSNRWNTIDAKCSKFQGSFEKIPKRHIISGLSALDMVKPLPP
jgi:hypothetical protein